MKLQYIFLEANQMPKNLATWESYCSIENPQTHSVFRETIPRMRLVKLLQIRSSISFQKNIIFNNRFLLWNNNWNSSNNVLKIFCFFRNPVPSMKLREIFQSFIALKLCLKYSLIANPTFLWINLECFKVSKLQ